MPFIVRWPGVVKAETVSDGLISQIDLMATIAAAVGIELAPGTAEDSHDQNDLWRGGASARNSMVHNTKADHYAIRQGDWVLIDAPSGSVSGVPEWFSKADGYPPDSQPGALFDLRADRGQLVNRFEQLPQKVTELRGLLQTTRGQGEVR